MLFNYRDTLIVLNYRENERNKERKKVQSIKIIHLGWWKFGEKTFSKLDKILLEPSAKLEITFLAFLCWINCVGFSNIFLNISLKILHCWRKMDWPALHFLVINYMALCLRYRCTRSHLNWIFHWKIRTRPIILIIWLNFAFILAAQWRKLICMLCFYPIMTVRNCAHRKSIIIYSKAYT